MLEPFPFVKVIPVQWGDQDAIKHVNNVVYFRWFECARINYFEGIEGYEMLYASNLGAILASITCDFRNQLRYPDTVHVGSRVTKIGNSSLQMSHQVISEKHAIVAAEATSTIVVFNYETNSSCRVPDTVRETIARVEGREFDD
ncbi:MAG: thioesterase [Planctomycetaceae bacterium]|nr:thioesterase [Planctomycetaceae bacterium]